MFPPPGQPGFIQPSSDPVVHLRILGNSITVLNDVTYAIDMLDEKSQIYSNRPKLVMGSEPVGWDQGPALIQSGKRWMEYCYHGLTGSTPCLATARHGWPIDRAYPIPRLPSQKSSAIILSARWPSARFN
ncbi:hypothetical protein B0H13DRAFT_675848 [Mycena leptocephala]|nr:hypothetical protein B0H13DRAFT_675848 [Mycena leptocephala]